MRHRLPFRLACLITAAAGLSAAAASAQTTAPDHPILFVTQVPVGNFGTVTSAFGNHVASVQQAPRGGDLVLRYPDGSLRFLTREAGYGEDGQQGANAIAVREPTVHWSGEKAVFSMVVGAPTQRYQVKPFHWQIYEVTGLAPGQTAAIRRIAGQPAGFNNVSPIYATDGRILFTSDRPPSGAAHHYPQLDEYESSPTVAGIYGLDEATGALTLLEHAPSGAFSLSIDRFGRVVFTKWDHLQRDQQGDAPGTAAAYRAYTYASEAAGAPTTTDLAGAEVFPEPRTQNDPAYAPSTARHSFNHFFPWEMNEDGTGEETLNHIGRHELGGSYTDGSVVGDPNLTYHVPESLHANRLRLNGSAGLLHFREDPTRPGDFLATYAQEFGTASGGTLMRLTGAPNVNADAMVLTAVTPTGADAQVPQDTGYFRNPLPMADGTLVAVHTAATGQIANLGSTEAPSWSYAFRLKVLARQGDFWAPAATLTPGIVKRVTMWTPDVLATFDGPLWELDPVEVVARPVPTPRRAVLPSVEAGIFAQVGVDPAAFQASLRSQDLALVVARDVTQRDRADRQQPFNLRVPGGTASIGAAGAVYDVAYLQVFQADALRGYGDPAQPRGRRLLARPMHAPGVSQAQGAPPGAVKIAPDGSVAALVPARRALSWQLTDGAGAGVVRERNWISFQAGEIRVCTSCHGVNTLSQTGEPAPEQPPEALRALLAQWKASHGGAEATPTTMATTPPTTAATNVPTAAPTSAPTSASTAVPTAAPTASPTRPPTATNPPPSVTSTRPPTASPTPAATAAAPIVLTAVRDTWIDEVRLDQNKGADTALRVRPPGDGLARRALVAFDLGAIPAGACVRSAQLRLRLTSVSSPSRVLGVHRLSHAWVEGNGKARSGATWRTADGQTAWPSAGGAFAAAASATAETGTVSGATLAWDVTADVAAFVAGSAANHGWLIQDTAATTGGDFRFASRQHGTSAARPRLVLALGCG